MIYVRFHKELAKFSQRCEYNWLESHLRRILPPCASIPRIGSRSTMMSLLKMYTFLFKIYLFIFLLFIILRPERALPYMTIWLIWPFPSYFLLLPYYANSEHLERNVLHRVAALGASPVGWSSWDLPLSDSTLNQHTEMEDHRGRSSVSCVSAAAPATTE